MYCTFILTFVESMLACIRHMIKERKNYRIKYQYELLESLTGKNRRTIRQAMYRMGLGNETEDFIIYINKYVSKL